MMVASASQASWGDVWALALKASGIDSVEFSILGALGALLCAMLLIEGIRATFFRVNHSRDQKSAPAPRAPARQRTPSPQTPSPQTWLVQELAAGPQGPARVLAAHPFIVANRKRRSVNIRRSRPLPTAIRRNGPIDLGEHDFSEGVAENWVQQSEPQAVQHNSPDLRVVSR